MCVSTAKQQPLEEIFASQVYGLTVYLKTNTHDRFGKSVLLPRERAEKKKHGKFILIPICYILSVLYDVTNVQFFRHRIRFDHRKQQCRFAAWVALCRVRSDYSRKSHYISSRSLYGTRWTQQQLNDFVRDIITN